MQLNGAEARFASLRFARHYGLESGVVIKDQYVGDVNDYFKYAFLRSVQRHLDIPLIVCWMATADDDGTDGRRRKYLEQPAKYRDIDSSLFDQLDRLLDMPNPGMAAIENAGILEGALFHSDLLGDSRESREIYFSRLDDSAPSNSLIFFDPDNGLEIKSTPKGRKNCSKFLFLDELQASAGEDRTVIIYQHFGRVQRTPYTEAQLGRIEAVLPGRRLFALAGSHIAFLVATAPEHAKALSHAAGQLSDRWQGIKVINFAA